MPKVVMWDDRNKTELTKDVTAAVVAYLDERGCKPLETEVWICQEWVADIAGVLNPTQTELIDLKLIPRRPPYQDPRYLAWEEIFHNAQRVMTVIVEVKTSRSDFIGDRKWNCAPAANVMYVAIPNDLSVSQEEMPHGWGVLTFAKDSQRIRLHRAPTIHSITAEEQLGIVMQIAARRDNNTRYERLRQLQRRQRDEQNASKSLTRMSHAMRAMMSIVKGEHGSVENALAYHNVKMPEYMTEKLNLLWGVASNAAQNP